VMVSHLHPKSYYPDLTVGNAPTRESNLEAKESILNKKVGFRYRPYQRRFNTPISIYL
jgi:hypothetical protein